MSAFTRWLARGGRFGWNDGSHYATLPSHNEKPPVPPPARGSTGQNPGAGKAAGPPVTSMASPAPGHHRGNHMVIDTWACGCIYTWTRATGWARDYNCLTAPPACLSDTAIEEFLNGHD